MSRTVLVHSEPSIVDAMLSRTSSPLDLIAHAIRLNDIDSLILRPRAVGCSASAAPLSRHKSAQLCH